MLYPGAIFNSIVMQKEINSKTSKMKKNAWRKPRAIYLVISEDQCFFYLIYKDFSQKSIYNNGAKRKKMRQWLVKLDNRIKNPSFLALHEVPNKVQRAIGAIKEQISSGLIVQNSRNIK